MNKSFEKRIYEKFKIEIVVNQLTEVIKHFPNSFLCKKHDGGVNICVGGKRENTGIHNS